MIQIPNSKGYFISKDGRVFKENLELKCNNHEGYRRVSIAFNDGTSKRFYVHRLVAMAYIENTDNKPFINHIDCNKSNNNVENLEWVTNKENAEHASVNGLLITGEDVKSSLYSDEQIRVVCKMLENRHRLCDIQKETGVCQKTVSMIKNGKQWTTISKDFNICRNKGALSLDTIRWVCFKLQEGYKPSEIEKMSDNVNVTYSRCWAIYARKTYSDISKDFKF